MGIFTSAKAKLAAQKLAEEQLFEFAAEEIAANNIRPGLWAKAIAESDGDDAKAKARYIKLRVEAMKAEADLSSYVQETATKSRAANETKQSTTAGREKTTRPNEPKRHSKAVDGSSDDLVFALVWGGGIMILIFFIAALAQ